MIMKKDPEYNKLIKTLRKNGNKGHSNWKIMNGHMFQLKSVKIMIQKN